jgi:hypothetical protein
MASAVFTQEHEEIIKTNSIARTIDKFRDELPKDIVFDQYILSATSDKGKYFQTKWRSFPNGARCQV